jgi:phospholipase/lecithinase/hemolysin
MSLVQVSSPPAWAGERKDVGGISQVIAFGDSFSDNGVKQKLSTNAVAVGIPNAKVKPDPKLYFQGRYSNGLVAVEILANRLNVKLTDYAVGGAMSGDQNYDSWLDDYTATGVQAQIASFRHDLAGRGADSKALYFVGISANDYFKFIDFAQPGVLFVGSASPASLAEMAERAAQNTRLALDRLIALGARRFLVSKSYDLKGPYVLSAGQSQIADEFARQYNDALIDVLASAEHRHGVSIKLFDFGGKMQEIIDNPGTFGITNSTDACETTFPVPKPPCANPDAYMFWDEYHPTRRAHEILGGMMEEAALEH